MRLYVDAVPLAGRTEEAERLTTAMRDAAAGHPRVVLVHGEAGIGKTRLVSEVCARERANGTSVLWGQCINFGATSPPYVPLVSAIEDWLDAGSSGSADDRAGLVAHELLAALSGDSPPGTARLVRLLDSAMVAITTSGPAVLVVDDVQWADTSTLDLLAYLLATLRPQRLTVLMTYRDTELPEGHYLHGWLADARRLPSVSELRLGRLTREETEDQVARLLGRPAPMSLVDAVHSRSTGNPYLNELLLRNIPPDATGLPDGVTDDLRSALLSAWHRLGADARELTRLLATAQKPLPDTELETVARHLGLRVDLGQVVAESVAAGVMVRDRSGDLWFHHPLLAELLYDELSPGERRRLHAAFVTALVQDGPVDPPLAAHLALHAECAGLPDQAFRYAIVAAAHAASVNALPEEAEQRRRAAQLWEAASPHARKDHPSESRLWCEAATAAMQVGWEPAASEAADAARRTMDPDADPAAAARALRVWAHTRPLSEGAHPQDEALRQAVRLSAAADDLEEHAVCLADLSEADVWNGDTAAARDHADGAMHAAERIRTPRAMAWALAARAFAHDPTEQALQDAERSYRLALETQDADTLLHAVITRSNLLEALHRFGEKAEVYERGYALSVQLGFGRHRQVLAAYTIAAMMDVGRYEDARHMLGLALAVPANHNGGLSARLNGVALELCAGDLEAATRHLDRAREIAPNLMELPGQHGAALVARYHTVCGHPELAVQPILEHFRLVVPGEPSYGDWLVLYAAMATGELARADDGPRPAPDLVRSRAALVELLEARRDIGGDMFSEDDGIAKAHRLVLEAELARAFGHDDELDRWRKLTDVPDHCGEAWVMTQAIVHWAQGLLDAQASRAESAVPLHRAYDRSREFGFHLLVAETESLAQRAGIPLTRPTRLDPRKASPAGLTNRERDVLGLLADGQTYAGIAKALFISQKTVSVHVTHILQKTKTSSRAEAAAWAWHNAALRPPVAPGRDAT
jgi:DNA-binding CsgD family transcriptional regulator/tetratricopeptide (TPR) repeat protein